jgi:hypothetical protein
MSDSQLVSRSKLISDAFFKAVEFDIKIGEDRLQYSSWLLAIAAAGLGIAVTQTKPVLEASLLTSALSDSASKVALLVAATTFVLSAVSGAVVKVFTNKDIESCRQRLTLVALQTVWIEAGENLQAPKDSISDLIRSIAECKFLPPDKQEQFQEFKANGKRADKFYQRALVAQQVCVGAGYALLLCIAML